MKDSWGSDKLKGPQLAKQVGSRTAREGSLGYAEAVTGSAEMPAAALEDVSVQRAEETGCCEAMAGEGRSLKEPAAGGGGD